MQASLAGVRSRLSTWWVVALIVCACALFAFPENAAYAQDAAAKIQEDETPTGATDPAPALSTTNPKIQKVSYFAWLYKSLGPLYSAIFLLLTFMLLAFFFVNLLQTRRETVIPSELIEGFEANLESKQYQEAYQLARSDDSFLGKVLAAGLGKVSIGYEHAIEAMQEIGEDETMKMDQRLGYLALIGTISPMFGLLGTVDGMVQSFTVIAQATTAPKSSELADGISMALVTTLVGLWLAIPAIAAHHFLKNRVARLVLETGIISENLMSRFQTTTAKQPPSLPPG